MVYIVHHIKYTLAMAESAINIQFKKWVKENTIPLAEIALQLTVSLDTVKSWLSPVDKARYRNMPKQKWLFLQSFTHMRAARTASQKQYLLSSTVSTSQHAINNVILELERAGFIDQSGPLMQSCYDIQNALSSTAMMLRELKLDPLYEDFTELNTQANR